MHRRYLKKKGGMRELSCMRKEKKRREKKETKWAQVSSECTLGFWLRVREVRTWATSVVSPPNFRKSIINLSSASADNLKYPRSQQIKIEGVRSTSAIKRVQPRTSIREELIRLGASCGRSAEARHTVWLYYNNQTLPTVIRLRRSTTRTKVMCSEHITAKYLL